MEQPTSGSTNQEDKQTGKSANRRNDVLASDQDSSNQRMVADRLLAALANGNLDNLAQAREAFLKQAPKPVEFADNIRAVEVERNTAADEVDHKDSFSPPPPLAEEKPIA